MNTSNDTKESMVACPIRAVALEYAAADISVIPIRADGSKAPACHEWKKYQQRAPTPEEIAGMFVGDVGIAIICGAASGGLEAIDFDQAGVYDQWRDLTDTIRPGISTIIDGLPHIRTPSGGDHIVYRCAEIGGNTKLAVAAQKFIDRTGKQKDVLIETRGEGGYFVTVPSPALCHIAGVPYEQIGGLPLPAIPTITSEERAVMHLAARALDERGKKEEPRTIRECSSGREAALRPGDDYDRRGPEWSEILGPAGWTIAQSKGSVVYLRRPGKTDGGISATVGRCGDRLFVFSTNASPFEAGKPYSKFAAYTLLHHGGDFVAAARELRSQGFGDHGPTPPTAEERAGSLAAAKATLSDLPIRLKADPGAVFAGDMLAAMSIVQAGDPAEWARLRSAIKKAGVSIRDVLHKLMETRTLGAPAGTSATAGDSGPFLTRFGATYFEKQTANGPTHTKLCNFTAHIVAEQTRDDGAERKHALVIVGADENGNPFPAIDVPADAFAGMNWVPAKWGSRAIVCAGWAKKDQLREAIQLMSPDVERRTIFGDVGWHRIGEHWRYLHGGGAIGSEGSVDDIEVDLGDPRLECFTLPEPPDTGEVFSCVQASLYMAEVARPEQTYPLLAAVYRAPLGQFLQIDFSVYAVGPTGCQKTALTACAQGHFGASFSGLCLPGNWSSTGNSLEKQAFLAKDAMFVVDDFAPTGTLQDIARMHRDADRLLRAQGNRAGRSRMAADGSLRPVFAPRGLVVSSGEDIPRGQSLQARLVVLTMQKGDVNLDRLTKMQRAAERGLLAGAIASYVQWLAAQADQLSEGLRKRFGELRAEARSSVTLHDRTPEQIASLMIGMETFLRFAREVSELDAGEAEQHRQRCWQALIEVAKAQSGHQVNTEPTQKFLTLLGSALASGRAHVADPLGDEPKDPGRWGWRSKLVGVGENERQEWQSQGDRVGWVSGDDLYLEPEAAYIAAHRMAVAGDGLSISQHTLAKRLHERGLLKTQGSGRLAVRVSLDGARRYALHLRADAVMPCAEPRQLRQPGAQDSLDSKCGTRSVDLDENDI